MSTPGWMNRLFELYGGRDKFFAAMEAGVQEFNDAWNQNTHRVGRVLRAHLVVEYYLTRYLQFKNPRLGSLEDARLSYSQKVELVSPSDCSVSYLIPGLRRLGTIRNRLAHNLNVDLTDQDRNAFLSIGLFKAMRDEGAMRGEGERRAGVSPDDPISIMEDFSKFAGSTFQGQSVPQAEYWREAMADCSIASSSAVDTPDEPMPSDRPAAGDDPLRPPKKQE